MKIGTLVSYRNIKLKSIGVIVEIDEKYRPFWATKPEHEKNVIKYRVKWFDESEGFVKTLHWLAADSLNKIA